MLKLITFYVPSTAAGCYFMVSRESTPRILRQKITQLMDESAYNECFLILSSNNFHVF